ncbi:MAG: OsmC family protein [Chitinophagaceae bacterium]|nr:OsmC family protein [Chitinophagaceae bacterium]
MEFNATVSIKMDNYKMEVMSGGGNALIADEPLEVGGQNLGFSPDELLCAALGACTSATLRMYADRKGWPVERVDVKVSFERETSFSETKMFRSIHIEGNLSEEQRTRLFEIAEKCPVHKTFSRPISIETNFN